ncbi:MAG: hypothetical protein LBN94_01455 [Puniceicoccales bacterium]|jgi:hypothetical protein|nr:hypothetical protein [Puniceicoccales bacterium]
MNNIANWFPESVTQLILWIVMVIALMGSYFNATMRMRLSYLLWLLTNTVLVWHNFCIGERQQCVLYAVYLYTAILGLRNTKHHKSWLLPVSLDNK